MKYRLSIYLLSLFVVSVMLIAKSLIDMNIAYANGDRSAYAIIGFFPFLLPIFVLQASIFVIPISVIVELILIYMNSKNR